VIFTFLAKHNALTLEHLDLMWGASDGKHEANTRAVYDAVVLIAGDISDKCRKYLFDKI